MELLILLFLFLAGLAFGSFFNVCISRLPERKSLIPSSHCSNCHSPIKYYHNIPIFSYLLLMGRCRSCGSAIPLHHLLVEIITPLFFILLYFSFGLSFLFIKYIIFISVGIIIFFIDSHHKIIPDVLSLPLIILGFVFSQFSRTDISFSDSLAGAAFGFFIFWGTSLIFDKIMKRETLGGGDIKLIAGIGSFLGIVGTIFTMLLSSMTALFTIFLTGHDRKKEFPYGPFLIIGAVFYIFLNKSVFEFYLKFF